MRPAPSEKRYQASLPFARASGGVQVRLRVTPRAGRNGIDGLTADAGGGVRLKVAVSAAAEDGQANAAVLALLAKAWQLPRSSFTIRAGGGSRHKTVAIAGDPEQLMAYLAAWTGAPRPAPPQP